MALELFKPFVMKQLVDEELAQNIKSAKRMVERRKPQVWDVLDDVIKEHPVLLNRAPTLHRLGIQAFEPVLVEGKAIQIHPLVCHRLQRRLRRRPDGRAPAAVGRGPGREPDAHAVGAQRARPAHGRPLVTPTQDMVIGAYYLTQGPGEVKDGKAGQPVQARDRADGAWHPIKTFRHVEAVERAYEAGDISLHEPIVLRSPQLEATAGQRQRGDLHAHDHRSGPLQRGPARGLRVRQRRRPQAATWAPSSDVLADAYPKAVVAETLDGIKNRCFRFATQSGLTFSIDDVRTPEDKQEILDEHEKEAEKVEDQFHRGIITDGERRQKEVEIWTDATDEVQHQLEENLAANPFNPIDMMVRSGARGEHHADPPDRGHARPRGQPPRRHDPPPDQVQLP